MVYEFPDPGFADINPDLANAVTNSEIYVATLRLPQYTGETFAIMSSQEDDLLSLAKKTISAFKKLKHPDCYSTLTAGPPVDYTSSKFSTQLNVLLKQEPTALSSMVRPTLPNATDRGIYPVPQPMHQWLTHMFGYSPPDEFAPLQTTSRDAFTSVSHLIDTMNLPIKRSAVNYPARSLKRLKGRFSSIVALMDNQHSVLRRGRNHSVKEPFPLFSRDRINAESYFEPENLGNFLIAQLLQYCATIRNTTP
jgi:hypothetical protein